jgi:hypothetical protein
MRTSALFLILTDSIAFTVSLHLFGLWIISSHVSFGQDHGLASQASNIERLLQAALANLKYMGKASLLSSKAYTRLRTLFDLLRDKGGFFDYVAEISPLLIMPVECTISTLSPQDARDGLSEGFSATPQGSSWIGRHPDVLDTQSSDFLFPSFEEHEPDSLFAFLLSQDTIGFDYDFGGIVNGQCGI